MFLNCYCPGIAQDNSLAPETERIFLHTDRNVYMTGEYLYYKLYLKGVIGRESKYAYLVIRDIQNVPVTQIRVEINNQTAFGSIYLSDTLHSDIYQMVCYTNCMRNSGEDSFFNKEVVIANRFDKEFSLLNNPFHDDSSSVFHNQSLECTTGNENLIIHLGKEIFDQREKVIFSVEPQDINKYSLLEFSVSISEIAPDISAEPSISEYFNKVFEASPNEEPVQNQCNFLPEINGTVIKGQISTSQFNSNLAANHSEDIKINNEFYTLLVSARDSLVNMQYAKTDSLGKFSFFLNPYYEGKELFMQLQEKVNAVIEIDDKLRLTKPFTPSVRFNMPGIRDYMNRSKNILEVQRYYSEKPLLIFENEFQPATTIPRVYYKPSLSVLPEDYIDLSDFIEISREILPSIKVRKSNDNYILSFTGTLEKSYNNYKPIIFLDGVPINDTNRILHI